MKVYVVLTKDFKFCEVCESKVKAEKLVEELYSALKSVGVYEEKYRIVEKILN